MAIALDDVYSNFREYILNNLNYELDKTFKLQNKEELCDDDRTSFNWFKDIKIYKSEYTFSKVTIYIIKCYCHTNSPSDTNTHSYFLHQNLLLLEYQMLSYSILVIPFSLDFLYILLANQTDRIQLFHLLTYLLSFL